MGPYGSAVWWLATLYSSSYGHHGLRPCSTDHREAALSMGLHGTRLTSLGGLLLTPAVHSLCTARHRPALTMRLHQPNDGLHGCRAGLWLVNGFHMMKCNAGAGLKAGRSTVHAVGCWVALDHPRGQTVPTSVTAVHMTPTTSGDLHGRNRAHRP